MPKPDDELPTGPPARCPGCEWTNTGLLNYGVPGHPIWRCHGCAARIIRGEEPIHPVKVATPEVPGVGGHDMDGDCSDPPWGGDDS